MPLISTRSIVLQGFPYSETSRILRLLTPDHGVRSVLARGARRPRSRFSGLLELFTEGTAQISLREGRELQTLTAFDLTRSRQALGRDLTRFSAASLLAELVLRSGTEEPHPNLFAALSDALDDLTAAPPDAAATTALTAVWSLISLLGFQPELGQCVHCGRALQSAEPARFDVDAGGVTCLGCRPVGRIVDPETRAAILAMNQDERPEDMGDPALQGALLRVFLQTHLAHGAPLRSLPLLIEQLR